VLVSLLNRDKPQDGAILSAHGCGEERVAVFLFFAKDITSLFLLFYY
jgi:hypothetical protein